MPRKRKMRMKGVLSCCVCIVLITCFSASFALEQTQPQTQIKQEQAKEEEIISQLIQLVVENSPALQEQRNLIVQIEKILEPAEGFVEPEIIKRIESGALEETPFLTLDQAENIRNQMINRIRVLSGERRTYEDLKKNLLSELLSKITRILTLKNKKQNLNELKSFFQERRISLEKQVKAGVEEPVALFDLIERIMNVSLGIQNTASELEILKLEVATNFGGQRQQELLSLLDKI